MKIRRPILTVLFSSAFFVGTLSIGLLNSGDLTASIFKGEETEAAAGLEMESEIEPDKTGEWSYCQYEAPELPQYNVELESLAVSQNTQPGEVIMVDMTFKNTGNTRLFSLDSGCDGAVLMVGTQREQDRISLFSSTELALSGWVEGNGARIEMSDSYADPDQSFHVTWASITPGEANLYREYFQPVVEGIAWIGEVFPVDLPVAATEQMNLDVPFIMDTSMAASELTDKERNIIVDLSDQMLYAGFQDATGANTVVWSMQISSGAWDTPTPPGNYEILTKQELRIGSAAPHYRMPYFQLWDWRGYGFHALPYLANDGGVFWTEALNHIGIPVSHGCIRMLPDDAAKFYEFTDIGTPVLVQN